MVKKKTQRKKAKKSTREVDVPKTSTSGRGKGKKKAKSSTTKRKRLLSTGIGHQKIRTTPAQKEATKKVEKMRQKAEGKKPVTKIPGKGRPTIITQDLIDKVCSLIMAGAYIETACASVGFAKKLYFEWLKLGNKRKDLEYAIEHETDKGKKQKYQDDIKKIHPIYQQFSTSILKAVIDGEVRDIARIDIAASKSWQAAAWKLERKHPERWARQQRIEHAGEVKTTPTNDITATRSMLIDIMKDPKSLALAEELIDRMNGSDED